MNPISQINIDFLISSLHLGFKVSVQDVLLWMKNKNAEVISRTIQIPLKDLQGWHYDGCHIHHQSGKFFSIDGVRITTNYGVVRQWDQPIINQPEIGFLGFIVKKMNGVYHFLAQAKIEPGNINIVQLSPTLQATRSNYMRVHKGASPLYLEYFTGGKKTHVLVDQLQSEQGARFFRKRNRNIIVEVDENEDLPIYDNYVWLTLGQIKELLTYPNIVNMDTRTVISCLNYGQYSEESLNLLSAFRFSDNHLNFKNDLFLASILGGISLNSIDDIIRWITSRKFKYELNVLNIPISEIRQWSYNGDTLIHENHKYFEVIGVNVRIDNREVISWDQPMIKSVQEGIIGFLIKKINGIYHFLVQSKLEAGNFDIVEMAPTVQCLTGNYRKGKNEYTIPYIEYFVNAVEENIWYSAYQSEEGGRFFKEQNLNIIVEVGDDFPVEVEEDYCWMTLNQMFSFVTFNNYLNIAARSLLSAVKFH